jgi:hypothetical protein
MLDRVIMTEAQPWIDPKTNLESCFEIWFDWRAPTFTGRSGRIVLPATSPDSNHIEIERSRSAQYRQHLLPTQSDLDDALSF